MNIPAASQPGLIQLFKASQQEIASLETAFRSARVGLSSEDLVDVVVKSVPADRQDAVRITAESIIELYSVHAMRGDSDEEFASDLVSSMHASGSKELKEIAKDASRVQSLTSRILKFGPGLEVAAKSSVLSRASERRFCAARVFTDIRPIFGTSIGEKPAGVILTHTLKILYHLGDGSLESFFVTLDDSGLSSFNAQLDRAKAKGRSLAASLSKSGWTLVSENQPESE